MRKNRLIALIGTLTMAAAGLAAVSAGVSSKKAESVNAGNTITVFINNKDGGCSASTLTHYLHCWGGDVDGHDYVGTFAPSVEGGTGNTFIKFEVDSRHTDFLYAGAKGSSIWDNDYAKSQDMSASGWSNGSVYEYYSWENASSASYKLYYTDVVSNNNTMGSAKLVEKGQTSAISVPTYLNSTIEHTVSGTANTGYQFKDISYSGGTWSSNPNDFYAWQDQTITVNFEAITADKYSVTFNSNGGTGSAQVVTTDVGTVTKAIANPFTAPSGKKFMGWSTTTSGSVDYAVNADIPSQSKDSNLNLYAVWQLNDPTDGLHIKNYTTGAVADFPYVEGEGHNQYEGQMTFAAGDEFKIVGYYNESETAWHANIQSGDDASAAQSKYGPQISGGGNYDGCPNLKAEVAGTYKVYMKDDDCKIYIPYIHYDVTYVAGDGSGDPITDKVAVGMDNIVRSNSFTAPTNKMFANWLGSDGETYNPSDTFQLGQGETITLTAQWRDKTVEDGFYIEGIIGGSFQRISGEYDSINNQYVFADVEFSEGDHFKAVKYVNEVASWAGAGQLDNKDGSAAKEGQVVTGDNDDIAIASGCAGVYTVYFHDNYETKKVYIPALYTVTWKNYDDTVLATEKYTYTASASYKGETPTKPADASYTYTHSGWNPTPGSVLGDTTYTAQFSNTPVNYTITYDTDGTLKSSVPDSYNCDSAVTLPTESDFESKPDNARFAGWFNNNSYSGDPITSIPVGSTGNKTFYGKWDSLVTVTYYDLNHNVVGVPHVGVPGSAIDFEIPAVPQGESQGYTYSWSEDLTVYPNDNLNVEVALTPKQFRVSFDMNGGPVEQTPADIMRTFGTTYAEQVPGAKMPEVSRTGYDFDGWYLEIQGSSPMKIDENSRYTVAMDMTLKAYWTAKETSVTLNPNGGSGGSTSITATYDASMPSATMPELTGYRFKGYFDAQTGGTQYYTVSGASARAWDKVGETATLYAQWEEIVPTVTVTVNNSAYGSVVDGEGNPVSTFTVPYNTEVIVYKDQILFDDYEITAVPTESTDAITYSFDKWDGIEDGDSITENIEIEAIFTATNNPLITIKSCENGHIEVDGEEVSSFYVPAGSVAEIADDYISITNDNDDSVNIMIVAVADVDGVQYDYAFESWSGISEGEITSDIELSATFSKTPVKYQLSWDFGGGTPTGDYTLGTVAYDSAITYPTNVSKDGYEFTGFDKELSTMPAENTKITAQFTAIDYTITFDKDGGEGGGLSATSYQISDAAQTITITDPVKDGYAPSYSVSGPDDVTVSGNTITIPANTIGAISVSTSWTITAEGEAKQFATKFLEEMAEVCILKEVDDKIVVETVVEDLKEAWDAMASEYAELSGDAKALLKAATPVYDESSDNIVGKFAASYDYIWGKYHVAGPLTDFVDRKPADLSASRNLISINNVSTSTWIIASVAIVGIAAVGVFFIYRKRKEN